VLVNWSEKTMEEKPSKQTVEVNFILQTSVFSCIIRKRRKGWRHKSGYRSRYVSLAWKKMFFS